MSMQRRVRLGQAGRSTTRRETIVTVPKRDNEVSTRTVPSPSTMDPCRAYIHASIWVSLVDRARLTYRCELTRESIAWLPTVSCMAIRKNIYRPYRQSISGNVKDVWCPLSQVVCASRLISRGSRLMKSGEIVENSRFRLSPNSR